MTSGFKSLQCPQCSGALPRVALWKWVECPWCHTTVTLGEETVHRRAFQDAQIRLLDRLRSERAGRLLHTDRHTYCRVQTLISGAAREVCVADREGVYPQRVVLRIAENGTTAAARQAHSWSVHQEFRGSALAAARLLRLHMPRYWALEADAAGEGTVLVSHYPRHFEGTLADVQSLAPNGIEGGHAVWLWRRILGALRYLHECGWVHGQLEPAHVLVNSRDHLCLLLGWSRARVAAQPDARARDLTQAAWCIRAVLSGRTETTPALRCGGALGTLLQRCCDDTDWLATQSAQTLDGMVVRAASADFGPPRFAPFSVFNQT